VFRDPSGMHSSIATQVPCRKARDSAAIKAILGMLSLGYALRNRSWARPSQYCKASQAEKVMAEAGTQGLESLAAAVGKGKYPPVEKWNPPFCGDLDMRIAADGTWFYLGTPIGRPALVRLFASVIKREEGRYFLVTPVEKVGIRVEDAPFLAVEMEIENRGPRQDLI